MMYGNWFGGPCGVGNQLGGNINPLFMIFSSVTSILAIVLLCLGIAALWKYVNKK